MSWPAVFALSRAALGELQCSLCVLLQVLRCIVALLAGRSGSIFVFLRIIVDSWENKRLVRDKNTKY